MQSVLASSKGGLDRIIARAQWLDALDAHLRRSLPPALAGHCRIANVREDALIVLADSPTWRTAVQIHGDTLLNVARAAGLDLRKLIVKVSATAPLPEHARLPAPLSTAARAALRSAAEATSDPALRAQLLALASVP